MAKILLVDDNELNRDLLTQRLEWRGYEVVSAADGATGLLRAWTERPHLILMDMSMPVFDGWAATRQLKASPETRGIPIIAVTAHASPGDRERCLAAGCDDYDTKPINFDRLLGKIVALLNHKPPQGTGIAQRQ